MLGRSVRHVVVVLPALVVLPGCYRAPARGTLASVAAPVSAGTQSAGGQLARSFAGGATLTLTTKAGTTIVDVLSDSATARAIGTMITPVVPELKVESSASGGVLRLTALGRLGEYQRLFVVDGVPMSDGFRLSIRTSILESIDVVDDATVIAPYGPRAANGVVLISTYRKRE